MFREGVAGGIAAAFTIAAITVSPTPASPSCTISSTPVSKSAADVSIIATMAASPAPAFVRRTMSAFVSARSDAAVPTQTNATTNARLAVPVTAFVIRFPS